MKRQVELKLPRIEDATPRSLRDAFIAHTKLMIENGYDPEPIMCGMLWASATLGLDLHGSAWTAEQLRHGYRLQARDHCALTSGSLFLLAAARYPFPR